MQNSVPITRRDVALHALRLEENESLPRAVALHNSVIEMVVAGNLFEGIGLCADLLDTIEAYDLLPHPKTTRLLDLMVVFSGCLVSHNELHAV